MRDRIADSTLVKVITPQLSSGPLAGSHLDEHQLTMRRACLLVTSIIAALLVGCRKDHSINSPEPPARIVYSRCSGVIYGLVGRDTLYADSARILIDQSILIYADSSGHFSIDSLIVGVHQFIVNQNYFYELDSTIKFQDSSNILLCLKPFVGDYLNLAMGNLWTYSAHEYFGDIPTGYWTTTDAVFTWEITAVVDEISTKRYKVQEQRSYHTVINRGTSWPGIDTVGETSGSFFFVEDTKHRVTIEVGTNTTSLYHLASDLNNHAFNRYNVPISSIYQLKVADSAVFTSTGFQTDHWWSYVRIGQGFSSFGQTNMVDSQTGGGVNVLLESYKIMP